MQVKCDGAEGAGRFLFQPRLLFCWRQLEGIRERLLRQLWLQRQLLREVGGGRAHTEEECGIPWPMIWRSSMDAVSQGGYAAPRPEDGGKAAGTGPPEGSAAAGEDEGWGEGEGEGDEEAAHEGEDLPGEGEAPPRPFPVVRPPSLPRRLASLPSPSDARPCLVAGKLCPFPSPSPFPLFLPSPLRPLPCSGPPPP